MKIMLTIARWLFILVTPVFLITASIAIAFNSQWLYEYGFEKYDVAETTGLVKAELEKAGSGLIGYFNSDEEYINVTVVKNNKPLVLFNEREIIHLKDVKGLVWLDYRLLLGTSAYCTFYALWLLLWQRGQHRRSLAWATAGGSTVTLGLIGLFGLIALVDFNAFFVQFHLLSFSNDFWLLDPATDYLIMLFPEGFWYDATFMIMGSAIGMALIIGGLGGWYLWRKWQKTPVAS
jgi:integral membrane protein (TIGR01906 family)